MKSYKDFPLMDLENLLHAVIEVNPFTVPWNKMGEKWHEVAKRVQDARFCKGCDPDTYIGEQGGKPPALG